MLRKEEINLRHPMHSIQSSTTPQVIITELVTLAVESIFKTGVAVKSINVTAKPNAYGYFCVQATGLVTEPSAIVRPAPDTV